jgi:hypothetical protein
MRRIPPDGRRFLLRAALQRNLLLCTILALTSSTAAAETGERERLVDAGKVFVMLDEFYALSPVERARLTLSYTLLHDGRPAVNARMCLVVNGRRTPVPIGPDGHVERLPTASDMAAHAQVAVDKPSGYYHVDLDILPSLAPALEASATQSDDAAEIPVMRLIFPVIL